MQSEKSHPHIYVMRCGDKLKIGVAKNVERRAKQLQTGNAEKILVEYKRERKDAYQLEKHLHRKFAHLRTSGEWFSSESLTLREIIAACYGYIKYDWDD
jgi:hypothetical protein